MLEQKSLYIQQLRYRYLAYCVIRDAIGFYYGIPKFFNACNTEEVHTKMISDKIESLQTLKSKELNEKERAKCELSVRRTIDKRIKELEEDYNNCVDVLFGDNIWLQLLDVKGEYLKHYLDTLPENMKDELAVVPKWATRDHSLGRSYINDDFTFKDFGFK